MSEARKSLKDLCEEFMKANPELSRSKAKRIVEASLQRRAVRSQALRGDARYAPLTPGARHE